MEIRIMETMVRVCVFDEFGELLCDQWQKQEAHGEPEEGEKLNYKIQRRVLVGGELHNIRATNEQEYADKIVMLAVQAERKLMAEEKKESSVNFGKYAKRWFEVHSKPNLSTAAAGSYERQLNKWIIPALGSKFTEDITPEDVQILLNSMGDAARSTKDKMMMVLKQILDAAVEDKIIPTNPAKAKKVKYTGKKSKPREAYTIDQMQFIIHHLGDVKNPEDRAYLAMAAMHPMRPEEVLGLDWEDINFEENTIIIKRAVTHPDRNQPEIKDTKTEGSERVIGLAKTAKEILLPLHSVGFVFGGIEPYSYSQVRKVCERIQKDITFEESIVPSRFRPTVISDMYAETGDAKYVQEQAGHADQDVTFKHYIRTRQSTGVGAEVIDNLYSQKKHTKQMPENVGQQT